MSSQLFTPEISQNVIGLMNIDSVTPENVQPSLSQTDKNSIVQSSQGNAIEKYQQVFLNETWVECCNVNCKKWRLLVGVHDPVMVPEKWYCSMNSDKTRNSCEIPEQDNTPNYEVCDQQLEQSPLLQYVCTQFGLGSVVWVKRFGYWYPAIVDVDPATKFYLHIEACDITEASEFHVITFGANCRLLNNFWVDKNDIKVFPTGVKKQIGSLEGAVISATIANSVGIMERLKRFGTAAYLAGKSTLIGNVPKIGDSQLKAVQNTKTGDSQQKAVASIKTGDSQRQTVASKKTGSNQRKAVASKKACDSQRKAVASMKRGDSQRKAMSKKTGDSQRKAVASKKTDDSQRKAETGSVTIQKQAIKLHKLKVAAEKTELSKFREPESIKSKQSGLTSSQSKVSSSQGNEKTVSLPKNPDVCFSQPNFSESNFVKNETEYAESMPSISQSVVLQLSQSANIKNSLEIGCSGSQQSQSSQKSQNKKSSQNDSVEVLYVICEGNELSETLIDLSSQSEEVTIMASTFSQSDSVKPEVDDVGIAAHTFNAVQDNSQASCSGEDGTSASATVGSVYCSDDGVPPKKRRLGSNWRFNVEIPELPDLFE